MSKLEQQFEDRVLMSDNERKKEEFKSKLEHILRQKISAENIDNYVDLVVGDLIVLTEEIITDYKTEHPQEKLIGKELEDKAYTENGLTNISEFLDVAQKKSDDLGFIDEYIEKHTKTMPEVIVPPDSGKTLPAALGENRYEAPDIKHRLKSLLYILKENGIDLESIEEIVDGIVTKNMVRGQSYVCVSIPELNRLALICDEEKNASYVFDLEKLHDEQLSVSEVSVLSKMVLNELIKNRPKIGVRFVYSQNWMDRMESFLFDDLPDNVEERDMHSFSAKENLPKASDIEFDPWKYFWIDIEKEKHYGSVRAIAKKSQLGYRVVAKIIRKYEIATIRMFNNAGNEITGHCYEDIVNSEDMKMILNSPTAEKEGEWKGFYIDDEGKHWGTLETLGPKIGLNPHTLKNVIKKDKMQPKVIKDVGLRIRKAYKHEDLVGNAHIKEILEASYAAKRGEWAGCYFDNQGKCWATVYFLERKIKKSHAEVYKFLENEKIDYIQVRGRTGKLSRAYDFDAVVKATQEKNG